MTKMELRVVRYLARRMGYDNDAMWTLYGLYKIRFVQQDRLDDYYHSTIDPVVTNPIYLINHEGFQFYPENIGAAKMSYVRRS